MHLAFPDYMDFPAFTSKQLSNDSISHYVCRKLFLPKQSVRLGDIGVLTPGMPMPKAAVHKNYRPQARQYDVGFAQYASYVQTISISRRMEILSNGNLWRCVRTSYAGHHPATGFPVDDVDHLGRRIAPRPAGNYRIRCGNSGCWYSASQMKGRMTRATSLITGTITEFPNCL